MDVNTDVCSNLATPQSICADLRGGAGAASTPVCGYSSKRAEASTKATRLKFGAPHNVRADEQGAGQVALRGRLHLIARCCRRCTAQHHAVTICRHKLMLEYARVARKGQSEITRTT